MERGSGELPLQIRKPAVRRALSIHYPMCRLTMGNGIESGRALPLGQAVRRGTQPGLLTPPQKRALVGRANLALVGVFMVH